MCGIVGMFSSSNLRSFDFDLEDGMRSAMHSIAHRGPDDEGLWIDPNDRIALGHKRLSIIDLSPRGNQPMADHSGSYRIVFNGEIYNYVEIRDELKSKGHRFISESDTEVVLEAYKQWGIASLRMFNGMFAFALWDSRKKELFLARDPFGEKGLYYTKNERSIVFASEPKALFHLGVKKAFNSEALVDYFTFRSVPAPNTLFQDVYKLEAGHFLVVSSSMTAAKERYWSWSAQSISSSDPNTIQDELIDRLRQSVRLRLRSDVPVGSFLSGGVDSSLVTAIMAQEYGGVESVKTFSVTLDDKNIDESKYQAMVANRYGTQHYSKRVSESELVSFVDRWFYYCDDLVADPSAIALHFLSNVVKENGIKVVLSGEGADEIFAGYPSYSRFFKKAKIARFLGNTKLMSPLKFLNQYFGRYRERLDDILADNLIFEGTSSVFSRREITRLVMSDSSYRPLEYWKNRQPGERFKIDDVLKFDFQFRIPDDILVRTDRATMASSIEARVPFLDPGFVQWAFGVSPLLKFGKREQKLVLKKSAEEFLPHGLLYRKKVGFDLPIGRWLQNELKNKVERFVTERKISNIDYSYVERMCAGFYRNGVDVAKVWYWFSLECWYRQWIVK